MSAPEVTAETLTDEQILKIGRMARDGTVSDALTRELCVRALGLGDPMNPPEYAQLARERIASAVNYRNAAINARKGK